MLCAQIPTLLISREGILRVELLPVTKMTRQDVISFDLNSHGQLDLGTVLWDLVDDLRLFFFTFFFIHDFEETVAVKSVSYIIMFQGWLSIHFTRFCLVFTPYIFEEIRLRSRLSSSEKFCDKFLAKAWLLLSCLVLSRSYFPCRLWNLLKSTCHKMWLEYSLLVRKGVQQIWMIVKIVTDGCRVHVLNRFSVFANDVYKFFCLTVPDKIAFLKHCLCQCHVFKMVQVSLFVALRLLEELIWVLFIKLFRSKWNLPRCHSYCILL